MLASSRSLALLVRPPDWLRGPSSARFLGQESVERREAQRKAWTQSGGEALMIPR